MSICFACIVLSLSFKLLLQCNVGSHVTTRMIIRGDGCVWWRYSRCYRYTRVGSPLATNVLAEHQYTASNRPLDAEQRSHIILINTCWDTPCLCRDYGESDRRFCYIHMSSSLATTISASIVAYACLATQRHYAVTQDTGKRDAKKTTQKNRTERGARSTITI